MCYKTQFMSRTNSLACRTFHCLAIRESCRDRLSGGGVHAGVAGNFQSLRQNRPSGQWTVVLSRSFVFRLPLGILRAQCVAPQLKSPDDERPSWAIPIEGKETFWRIESLRDTMDLAAQKPQTRLINVCDREADFFELFEEQRRNPCVDLLVPAKHNRGIIVDPFKLFEAVQQAPLQTKVQVHVPPKRPAEAQ